MEPLAITGLSVVSPVGVGREAFFAALSDPEAAKKRAFAGPRSVLVDARFAHAHVAEVQRLRCGAVPGRQGPAQLRSHDPLAGRGGQARARGSRTQARRCVPGVAPERVGICAATAYGSLDSITEINRVAELEHPRYLNPSRFPNTVINSAAGYVSIWEGLEGPNVTIVDGNCGGANAVLTAETHIACGRADVLLVGGAEVISEPLYLAFEKLGIISEGDRPRSPAM